jgi:hypothetical protein
MDASILHVAPAPSAVLAQAMLTTSIAPKVTAAILRKFILECAREATTAEPTDTDARLHSFVAKLSGSMEGLGERELDAALWNLMTTHRQPTADEQLGIDWWNGLTEERRAHWLKAANSAAPFAAWQAFRAVEDDLAMEG